MAKVIDAEELRDMLMEALSAELDGYEYEEGDEEVAQFWLNLPWITTSEGKLFKVTVEQVTPLMAFPSVHNVAAKHPVGQFAGERTYRGADTIHVKDDDILCRPCALHEDERAT